MTIVATAGHVDHGKSTLVQALTGTDPDRWPEEKARGLTIDLGFAHLRLAGGEIAFVDVPGHQRFLKNMLAGVGAVNACLFVVAATEGWKPQSEEHLSILELLGIEHGVVALTMADLVTPDRLEATRAAVAERLASSPLAASEIVAVAPPIGLGLDELRGALDRLLAHVPPPPDHGRARLWIDRAFTLRGAGTVVTGSLASGGLRAGAVVAIEPGGLQCRVRSLQVHHEPAEVAGPGARVALNLAGASSAQLGRGHAVVDPGRWHLSRTFDASLTVLPATDRAVTRRGAFLLYLGSGEWPVRLRVLGADELRPGLPGGVRLQLPEAIPMLPGDRFVLRDAGRDETIGGGEVLDVAPVLPARLARPDRRVERVVAEHGWIDVDDLERLTGVRRRPVVGRWIVDPTVLEAARADLLARVETAMPLGVDVAALDARDRALLDNRLVPDVVTTQGRARLTTATDSLASHPFVQALASHPFEPPDPNGVARDELRALVREGLIVERDGHYFHRDAVDRAASEVATLLRSHLEGVTVAQVRDALGTTRRHALPLLAELDARRVTVRRGDVRLGGPRLPAAAEGPS